MTIEQRLDKIEDEFETVKQLLASAARYAESSHHRIDRLSERQDITQIQLDKLAVTVQVMGEKVDHLGETVDHLGETVNHLSNKIDTFIETTTAQNAAMNGVISRLEESQVSTNAAVERLEAILLKLI